MINIFIWALKTMRKMAMSSIWIANHLVLIVPFRPTDLNENYERQMTQIILFINSVSVCVFLDVDVYKQISKNKKDSKSPTVVHAGPGFTKTSLPIFKFWRYWSQLDYMYHGNPKCWNCTTCSHKYLWQLSIIAPQQWRYAWNRYYGWKCRLYMVP